MANSKWQSEPMGNGHGQWAWAMGNGKWKMENGTQGKKRGGLWYTQKVRSNAKARRPLTREEILEHSTSRSIPRERQFWVAGETLWSVSAANDPEHFQILVPSRRLTG
jgi:hypothetical protein